jgi:hypothetical protein
MNDTCPHCGYCKHCGRGGPGPYYPNFPWYPNTAPWIQPFYPTWTIVGTDALPVCQTLDSGGIG